MSVERAVPGEKDWAQLSAPHLARYLAAAEYCEGLRVLDAACGAGYGVAILQSTGAAEVCGVDIDRDVVGRAREQFCEPAIEFCVDNCEGLNLIDGPFDLICCFEAIEHFEQPERFLGRAVQLLSSDGVLLVSTPDRAATPSFVNGRPRNPFHAREWHRHEFSALLSTYFLSVEMRVQVESPALASRIQAVQALRQGLMWSNPLMTFVWRKWPLVSKANRSWTKLAGLAAPTVADYPIIPSIVAPAYGKPCFNFAICRRPILRAQEAA